MSISRSRRSILALVLTVLFIVSICLGCAAKKELYNCRVNMLVSTTDSDNASISSSDFSASKQLYPILLELLNSNEVLSAIQSKHPHAEFELSLEYVESTSIFTLVATSESQEDLPAICNTAADSLCAAAENVSETASCRIVAYATQAEKVR